MSTVLAFITHYSQDGAAVTREGSSWPTDTVIHGDLWRQMIKRECLPWAVADVHFSRIDVTVDPSRPEYINGRKDGRVQFSMADGHYAVYHVTGNDETADTVTLALSHYSQLLPPVGLR